MHTQPRQIRDMPVAQCTQLGDFRLQGRHHLEGTARHFRPRSDDLDAERFGDALSAAQQMLMVECVDAIIAIGEQNEGSKQTGFHVTQAKRVEAIGEITECRRKVGL